MMIITRKQKWSQRILLLLIAELASGILFLDPVLVAHVRKSSEVKDKQKERSSEEPNKIANKAEAYNHFSLVSLLEENDDFTMDIDEYKIETEQHPRPT